MLRIIRPIEAPRWLERVIRDIERGFREAADKFAVTATGTGSSQDIPLPQEVGAEDVLVFEDGALRWDDYTVSGQTLTITATNTADIVILER